MEDELKRLRRENSELRKENQELKSRLISRDNTFVTNNIQLDGIDNLLNDRSEPQQYNSLLTNDEIYRYSRQLLVPGIGPGMQHQLLSSKVLVIGAGGLGSAILPYLAGAGIGTIGIVDFDTVDISNLHRQILYRESDQGQYKCICAAKALKEINHSINVISHCVKFSHENASTIIEHYNLVIDASDNPETRYLVNDACVLHRKTLIYGSALGLEGQIVVLNQNLGGNLRGPCYRCIYPKLSVYESSRRCSDNGVLGPVTGVIGSLQAVEAIKILGNFGVPLSGRMCTYDSSNNSFYELKVKGKNIDCMVCSEKAIIKSIEESHLWSLKNGLGSSACSKLPTNLPSISCKKYAELMDKNSADRHVLLDVRPVTQFNLCHLDGSINIPYAELCKADQSGIKRVKLLTESGTVPIYCLCRRGNDSRRTVKLLIDSDFQSIFDIRGGLESWRKDVDANFPKY